VALWIEAGATWWVQLAGHLSAVNLQLKLEAGTPGSGQPTQELADQATAEALAQFPAYVSQLEAAGWWVGHPMLEADKTQRIQMRS
jgi:hypothetical protein